MSLRVGGQASNAYEKCEKGLANFLDCLDKLYSRFKAVMRLILERYSLQLDGG